MPRKERPARFNALLTDEAGTGYFGSGATEEAAIEDARDTAEKRGVDPDALSEATWSTGGPALKVVPGQAVKENLKRRPPPKDRPGYTPPAGRGRGGPR